MTSSTFLLGTGIGVLVDRWFLQPASNSPFPPYAEGTNTSTGHDAIPNPKQGVIQPGIHRENSGVHSAGIRYIGSGKGVGIVISPVLQKYTRQT